MLEYESLERHNFKFNLHQVKQVHQQRSSGGDGGNTSRKHRCGSYFITLDVTTSKNAGEGGVPVRAPLFGTRSDAPKIMTIFTTPFVSEALFPKHLLEEHPDANYFMERERWICLCFVVKYHFFETHAPRTSNVATMGKEGRKERSRLGGSATRTLDD